jgi:glycosyltransferase involved in cell wall biosynthesis
MQTLSIGFDAKRAFNNNTGLGNYSRTLLYNLAHYHPEITQYLFTPYKRRSAEVENLENVHMVLPSGLNSFLPSLWRGYSILGDIKKSKIQLFHGLSHELPLGISSLNIPTIVTIHDLIFLRYPELYPWIDRQSYLLRTKYATKAATKVLCISQQTAQDTHDFLKVPYDKIEVIYQTCDPSFYQPASSDKRELVKLKYKLPSDYLLYVGTLEPRKNALSILQALKLRPDINIPLVLVGDGKSYASELKEYVLHNDLSKKVIFLGRVDFADLPSIYQMAKIFIYPSIFEGFGIPVLEALFSKVPVITSQGSCFAEVGGENTQYINPHSPEDLVKALFHYLNNPSNITHAQNCGISHALHFTGEKLSQQLNQLYQRLV